MDLSGKVIMVVDDEEDLREILAMQFSSYGSQVIEAANGSEAFNLLKEKSVDAVVSDVRMPGGDGITLLKNIKQTFTDSNPLVFLVTGYADISSDEAMRMGAQKLFSKPFNLKELCDTVAMAVRA